MFFQDPESQVTITLDGASIEKADGSGARRRRGISDVEFENGAHIIDSLILSDFELIGAYDINPQSTAAGLRGPVKDPVNPLNIQVQLEPDERAAVLVEYNSGLLSWEFPDAKQEDMLSSRRGAGNRAIFTIHPGSPNSRSYSSFRNVTLGQAVEIVIEPIRTYVLRYAARKSIGGFAKWMEGDVITGPVWLTDLTGGIREMLPTTQWRPGQSAAQITRAANRVLLLVHGTFSSTYGSFSQLGTTIAGTTLLSGLAKSYDAIIGYDHKTLTQTPFENAREILEFLSTLSLPRECVIDCVAYSRGGLVLRTMIETLVPASELDFKFGKAVYVGCTNAGTHLADPENWAALANTYTNLIAAAVGEAAGIAAGEVGKITATQAIKTIGRFVQILPEVAVSERLVPGLAAMEPGGQAIRELNRSYQIKEPPARYFAVSSNFNSRISTTHSLVGNIAYKIADRFADTLFQDANDLVVNTASMIDFGPNREWIKEGDRLDFGTSSTVYHTVYFGSAEVAHALEKWLCSPSPGRTLSDLGPPQAARQRSGPVGSKKSVTIETFRRPRANQLASLPIAGQGDTSTSTPMTDKSGRCIAAEMQQFIPKGEPTNVFVAISPNDLFAAGMVASKESRGFVEVETGDALILRAIPTLNCEVVGTDVVSLDPANTDEQIIRFLIRGLAAGPAQIVVTVSQETASLATFTLKPIVVADAVDTIRLVEQIGSVAAPQNYTILRIYEYFENSRLTKLRFDFASRNPDVAHFITLDLPNSIDLNAYMRDVLANAEKAWSASVGATRSIRYERFMDSFIAEAQTSTDGLLPKEIRRFLWEHRTRISAVQVISENPAIPWELMYISDPDGFSREGKFLAEFGLVRWLHGVTQAGVTLTARPDRCHAIIPEYLDGRLTLNGAEQERGVLNRVLNLDSRIEADSRKVIEFLRDSTEDWDVLHFAGHGVCDTNNVLKAQLSMQGFEADGRIFSDHLTVDQVRQNMRIKADSRRGLVFINACQTGNSGYGLTGSSGFADAFIRPAHGQGVAAFVGALWSIDDGVALTFAESFYTALKNGSSLAEAQKTAQLACQEAGDLTWLSYTVYGNPVAKL